MPLCPQITNTPIDITPVTFAITAVTFAPTTATYAAAGMTFIVGDSITVSDVVPDGFNGTYTVTAVVAATSFTVANTTNATVTTGTGTAYQSPVGYTLDDSAVVYMADSTDVAVATLAAGQAKADAAAAANAAALAQTAAGTAQTTADGKNHIYRQGTQPASGMRTGDLWYDTSTGNKPYIYDGTSWQSAQDASIGTTLGVANAAQTTADGKNKVTYSASAPGATANAVGDIWWQFSGGVIVGQWTGAGGAGWNSNIIGSTVIANLDAGKITAGTISASISLSAATITGGSINIGSGVFQVSPSGVVTINAGAVSINSGAFAVSSSGAVTITAGTLNINTGQFVLDALGNVTTLGTVSCTNLTVTGGTIGGFTVSSVGLAYGSLTIWSSGNATYALTDTTRDISFRNLNLAGNAGMTALNTSGSATIGGNLNVNTVGANSGYQPVYWNPANGRFYSSPSSKRYKENIASLPDADYLAAILKLEPVTYTYKAKFTDTPTHPQFGLVAESVAKIPELGAIVNRNAKGQPDSLGFDRLAIFMIPALRQLNQKIESLQSQLAALETK
jgi:hypothetical protein